MHTRGRLTTGFSKPSKGIRFLRARALGGLVEIPGAGNAEAHSSGSLSAMMGCNCLVELPAGSGPVAAGRRSGGTELCTVKRNRRLLPS